MKYKVFNLVVTTTEERNGQKFENEIFNGLYASKIEAIRLAQKIFAKQPLNSYVCGVWAAVYPLTITEKGSIPGKRIYNLYKTL